MSEAGNSPRQFSREFKESAVRRLESGEALAVVSRQLGVARKLLYQWRAACRAFGAAGLNRKRGRKVGWKKDAAGRGAHRRSGAARGAPADGPAFFSRSLAALGRDDAERRRARLYAVIEKLIADEPQGFARDETNIRRLCALAEVSRAGYYRRLGPHPAAREDADLRDLIHRIALADRHYGYRRVKRELFRQGVVVSYKRVARLMREDNLLALRGKPFVPRTTMSKHDCPIRPNLVRGLKPTGLDQIWVADITYVRLAEDFVYLAVILDAFSRKVVGWALADHLQASLALAALDMALAARKPAPDSLIHHSDRGVQYASNAYVERLESHGVAISMSRPANPYDNAKAESFMKTLKAEEVNGQIYLDLEDAQRRIGAFIETVYNAKRLHSALGYKPPDEFEAALVRVERKPINCEAVSPF